MTLSSSEVGSISEYSLPRSLSAYIQARNQRDRKSPSCQTSSDSESRRGTVRTMSFRVIVSVFCFLIIQPTEYIYIFFLDSSSTY
jgi:hypothetical protein